MIQAAKIIGTGLATTGLIGAGVGIGVVFGALILGVPVVSSLIAFIVSLCLALSELAEEFSSSWDFASHLHHLGGEDDYENVSVSDWENSGLLFMESNSSGSNEGGMSIVDQWLLSDEVSATYTEINKSLSELDKLKREHKVSLLVDSKGFLSVELPSSIPEIEAGKIIDKVQDLDNKYNVASDHVKALFEKDKTLNNGGISKGWAKMREISESRRKDIYTDID